MSAIGHKRTITANDLTLDLNTNLLLLYLVFPNSIPIGYRLGPLNQRGREFHHFSKVLRAVFWCFLTLQNFPFSQLKQWLELLWVSSCRLSIALGVLTMCLLKEVSKHGDFMAQRISKRIVDATPPSEKDVYVWDSELKGFGLKVSPAGRKTCLLYTSPSPRD